MSNGNCADSTADVVLTNYETPTTADASATSQSVCNITTATLSGNTPAAGTGAWTTISGTGVATTPSSPTSGVTGLTVGAATEFRWTITNGPCAASTDDVTITSYELPSSPVAGSDQDQCDDDSFTLNATAPTSGTGQWSKISGTGSITDVNDPNSAVTGVTAGNSITARWTVSNGNCADSTADVVLTNYTLPSSADGGPDQDQCGNSTFTLAGVVPASGTGNWSKISGTGTITAPGSATSTVTGVTEGNSITVRWTVSNGPCVDSTADVVLTNLVAPTTADAGATVPVCNQTTATLSGNTPTQGTGIWTTISGTGVATLPNDPNSGVTGLTIGDTTVFRWSISNPPCAASTDDVMVIAYTLPSSADAGPDQDQCDDDSFTLNATTPTSGTGQWFKVSGTGSVTDINDPNSAVTGVTAGNSITLNWIVSNGPCADSTDDVVLTNYTIPSSADAGPDQDQCDDDSFTLNATAPASGTGQWLKLSGTGSVTDLNDPNSTVTGVTVGSSITIRWIVNSGPCADSTDEVTLTNYNYPSTSDAGPDQDLCNVTTTTLAAVAPGVGTGTWTTVSGTGVASSPNSANSAVTGLTVGAATVFRWTVVSGPCTDSTDDVTITVYDLPSSADAGPDQAACNTTTATLAATAPTSGTGVWTTVAGTGVATTPADPNSGVTGLTAGASSTFRWTVSNGACTDSTDEVTITSYDLPTITAIATDPAVCKDTSTTLTASGGVSYTWAPSATLSSGTGNPVIATPTATTTYTVTGTDANSCVNTGTVTVTMNTASEISVSSSTGFAICADSSSVLTASGAVTYTWSPATGLSATTGAVVTANPTITTTYTVLGTDANGCVDDTVITVTVNPIPTVDVGLNPVVICPGASVQIGGAAIPGHTYTWTPADSLDDPTSSNPVANPTVTTTYTLDVVDINGCPATDSVDVVVSGFVIPTINNDTTICSGDSVRLLAGGGSIYTWTPTTDLSNPNVANPWASPTTDITYTVTVDIGGGCLPVDTFVTISVNTSPTVTASSSTNDTICDGSSTILSASGATNYTWSPSTGLSSTTGTPVTANPTSTTTYTVVGTDVNSCGDNDTIQVFVHPLPTVAVTAGTDTFCLGDSTTLTASGAVSYTWAPGTGLSATTGASVTATPTATTTYTVTGTDANGCVSSDSIEVVVNPLPLADAGPGTDMCPGDLYQLNASGGIIYSWTPTDSLSDPNIANPFANPSDTTKYYVTVTDANGCVAIDSVTINVRSTTVVDVTSSTNDSICFGSSTTLTATGAATYTWSPGTGLSATTGSVVTANPTSDITYTVTGTAGSSCTDVDSITIIVNPLPTVAINATTDTFCIGGSAVLTASGADTYSWSPATGLSATTGAVVTATPTTTTSYTVIGTDTNGCVNIDSIEVVVNPLPIVDAGPGTNMCPGDSYQLNASGGIIYSWTPTDSLSDPNIANPFANPLDTITYYVTVIDVNGCLGTDSVTVNVGAGFSPTLSGDTSTCYGDSIALLATGGIIYSWSPAIGLSNPNIPNPNASPTITTTYTVTVTPVGPCLPGVDSITVVVNPLPVINVTASAGTNDSICFHQDSTALTASGGVSYNWSPSGGLSSNTGAVVQASPDSTTTYTVTGTDINGCSSDGAVPVIVLPLPIIGTTEINPICYGDTIIVGAYGAFTYRWSPHHSLSDSVGAMLRAFPDTTTTYTIIGTDTNGCVDTVTADLIVYPGADVNATASGNGIICMGASTTLTGTGGTAYNWVPSTGLDTSTVAVVVAQPTITTTYTLTGVNADGCIDNDTITVVVNPLPTISINSNGNTICIGDSTSVQVTGTSSYNWSPSTGVSNPTDSLVVLNPSTTTSYTITGTDNNGCQTDAAIQIVVNPLPTVAISGSNFGDICETDSVVMNASGASTYSWNPSTGLNTTTGASVVSRPPAGLITYTVIGVDANGCENTDVYALEVNAMPQANFGLHDTCLGYTNYFNNLSSLALGNVQGWSWTFGDGDSSSTQNPTHNYASAGTYTVTLTVTSDSGCVNVITKSLDVHAVEADFVPSIDSGDVPLVVDFTDLSTGNPSNHHWDFGDNSTSSSSDPSHTFDRGRFKVWLAVSDAYGCVDTMWITIVATKPSSLEVPNVFTPNGDGINDIFVIESEGLTEVQGIIYNRWGAVIYNWDQPKLEWDGRTNTGLFCSQGTYFYIIKAKGWDGEEYELNGFVTLLR